MIPNQNIHEPVLPGSLGDLPIREVLLPTARIGTAYTSGRVVENSEDITDDLSLVEADAYDPDSDSNTATATAERGDSVIGQFTLNLTLTQYRVYDYIAVETPMSLLLSEDIEFYWGFDFTGLSYYWSTAETTILGQDYEPKIDPNSFDGVRISRSYSGLERIHVLEDMSIEVPDPEESYASADFLGESVAVKVFADDGTDSGVQRTFYYRVKSAKRIYKRLRLVLEDAIIEELEKLFPTTELVRDVWSSDADAGEDICFPIPFGTAYIPLPSVFIEDEGGDSSGLGGERYYALGEEKQEDSEYSESDSDTIINYTISEVQAPRSWPKSTWSSLSYGFPISSKAGYRVFKAMIAESGDGSYTNGLFPEGSKFLSLPTKYSRGDTETKTALEDIVADLLFKDSDITIDKTEYLLSCTFEGAFAEKVTKADWLNRLLKMGHAALKIKDNGDRKVESLSKTPEITANKASVKADTFSFDQIPRSNPADGGYIQFPKSGDPQNILYKYKVGIGGAGSENPSNETLDLYFVSDTQEAQRLGSLYVERKIDREANLSFLGRPTMLCLNPDEVLTISGDLYEAAVSYDVVVTHIHIQDNLLTRVKCEKFGHSLNDYSDLSPSVIEISEDDSEGTWRYVVMTPDGSVDSEMSGGFKVSWDQIADPKPSMGADDTAVAIEDSPEITDPEGEDYLALLDMDAEDSASDSASESASATNLLKKLSLTNLMSFISKNSFIGGGLVDGEAAGIIEAVTVDANSTGFAAALYVASDGNYEEAKADAAGTLRCAALAVDTGAGAGKRVLRMGRIKNTGWSWTVGGLIFVSSATAGALTQTAPSTSGHFVQAVGEAVATDEIFFSPSYDAIELA